MSLKKSQASSLRDKLFVEFAKAKLASPSSTEPCFHCPLWPWVRFAIATSIGPIASASASEGNPPPLQCRARYMASNTIFFSSSEIISSTE